MDKLAYEFTDPQRWDVVVFRYPNAVCKNYIKRLVGKPGETIRIQIRRLRTRREDAGETEFQIARKPPKKLLAMLQPRFRQRLHAEHRPVRLARAVDCGQRCGQKCGQRCRELDERTGSDFCNDGRGADEQWFALPASCPDRGRLGQPQAGPGVAAPLWPGRGTDGRRLEGAEGSGGQVVKDGEGVRPQLITDFTAFDTSWSNKSPWAKPSRRPPASTGLPTWRWSAPRTFKAARASSAFELRKGGRRFQCDINVATGRATLSISGDDKRQWRPEAATAVRGSGSHEIRFSNCDNELRLWVDGRVAAFDHPTAYDDLKNHQPDESDLTPVGIGSAGAGADLAPSSAPRYLLYCHRWNSGGMVDYDYGAGPPPRDLLQYLQSHPQQRFVEFPRLEKGPGRGPVFHVWRQQLQQPGQPALGDGCPAIGEVGQRILRHPRLADRQGVFPLLASFVGRDSHARGSKVPCFIPTPLGRFPIVPDFRKHAACALRSRYRGAGCQPAATEPGFDIRRQGSQSAEPHAAGQHQMLEAKGLVKIYGSRRVVDGVDFRVQSGEIVGLLGPNGAGKTTSFRMVCGMIAPTRAR